MSTIRLHLDGHGTGSLHIDGHDVTRMVRGLSLDAPPDEPPVLTVALVGDMDVTGAIDALRLPMAFDIGQVFAESIRDVDPKALEARVRQIMADQPGLGGPTVGEVHLQALRELLGVPDDA